MIFKKQRLQLFILCSIAIILIIFLILYNIYTLDEFIDSLTNNVGLNKLGGIVYINLENRPDRMKLIKDELAKLGANDNKIHKVSGIFVPKNGHKGCIQSHIVALRIAKLNNWQTVGIFEDDAVLNDNVSIADFKYKYKNGLAELPNDWDVLMLATANTTKEAITNKYFIQKLISSTTGTAYIVNKNYYDTILNLFEYCNTMMTHDKWGNDNNHEPYALDQKWQELQKKHNWYCFDTDLLKQRNIISTTNAKGDKLNI